MELILFYSGYLLLAFLLAMALVFIVGGTIHFGTKSTDGFLLYFVLPMIFALAVSTLASGRDLSLPDEYLAGFSQAGGGGMAKWVQRITTVFLLAASIERLTVFVLTPFDPRKPHGLMIAFGLFWLCSVALPAAFGTRPTVSHEYIYSLLIGMAALLSTEAGAERAIRFARVVLVVFMLASLALIVVKKSMVLAPYPSSLIPGFAQRFSGLATGPNAMGPLAVLALICLWCYPFRWRALQWLGWVVALLTLLLTQSKTSWLAAVACFIVLFSIRARGQVHVYLTDPRLRRSTLAVLISVAALILFAMLLLSSGVLAAKMEKFLATKLGADMASLTGRNEIWAVAFGEWKQNILFGYGPSLWDPLYRYQIRIPAAVHAHNQLLNILAASGLIGLTSFLGYMGMLVKRFIPRFTSYNGFTAALLVLIFMRSISEVPLNLQSFGSESLFHMLLLMALAGAPALERARGPHGRRLSGTAGLQVRHV
ncbi:O-antigen ligase family protein [Roseateles sp.]|uniref:O-antigen ligase family protein n=1 Tax=Roseateles sp. TaxID=1971397 RepID=UPI0025F7C3FD|nr:O-antigen ligase family protein [Roseateles sp.]MBV8033893.1 O-antigen ligase family protein [Roseateles sp.]